MYCKHVLVLIKIGSYQVFTTEKRVSQMGFQVVLKSLALQAIYRITHFKEWGQMRVLRKSKRRDSMVFFLGAIFLSFIGIFLPGIPREQLQPFYFNMFF